MNPDMKAGPATRVTHVLLKNYKSIEYCNVALGAFNVLVGPNGAGKSNFIDALRLVSDSLRSTLGNALRERGGINEVRRRSHGHPTHFEIQIKLEIDSELCALYGFRVRARPQGSFSVYWEKCQVHSMDEALESSGYEIRNGRMISSHPQLNAATSPDGLYLTSVSGIPHFREVFQALTNMGFYNPNPDPIKDYQNPDTGDFLLRDGSNLASVLAAIDAESLERVTEYLKKIVPGIKGVRPKTMGHKVSFEVLQEMAGNDHPWRFPAVTMSDGTLRALTILVSLYQRPSKESPMTLVGIEEPETALHPGAAAALSDALLEASHHVQIIATSHSPELLDNKDIPSDAILAVVADKGRTQIGHVDEATKRALADHLYTTGELLKMGQIQPDPKETKGPGQITLF